MYIIYLFNNIEIACVKNNACNSSDLLYISRNFDHHGRPSFDAIYALLQGNDNDLVEVSQEEAAKTANPTSVKQLGGDPEVARDLYGDLQTYYSAVNIHSDPSTEEEEPV